MRCRSQGYMLVPSARLFGKRSFAFGCGLFTWTTAGNGSLAAYMVSRPSSCPIPGPRAWPGSGVRTVGFGFYSAFPPRLGAELRFRAYIRKPKGHLIIKVAPYQGKEGRTTRRKVHRGGIVAWAGDIGAGRKFGGGLTRGVESVKLFRISRKSRRVVVYSCVVSIRWTTPFVRAMDD
ncbi:hypothetical protein CTAM01_09961 [Colletotrichum tamarilloi]|uniref:Uncharacterized protein n=1 Tax=Colletotrichum tamarilloi TaxID=1209934 RepID=A0ABQ9R1M4_9PEZI|nr:uncharacterized protein CTAM01_09961 [Colletotrichum tamarilloi]KAK1492167.1 hypothetical protein CTAM01_09961 [Colletotrichum tamarilloi]